MENMLWRSASEEDARKIRNILKKRQRSPAVYLIFAGVIMFLGLTVHTLLIRLGGAQSPGSRNVFITVCYALIAAVIIALSIQTVRANRKMRVSRNCFVAEGMCVQKKQQQERYLLLISTGKTEGTVEVTREIFERARSETGIRIGACAESEQSIIGQVIL